MSSLSGIIWLVGVAGCGKSTVGIRLAQRLRRPFTDLDLRIEAAAGRSIATIFSQDGEAGFRLLEEQALADVSRDPPPPVVACGAGVVEVPGHARLMGAPGTVLWLDLPVDRALERCRRQEADRPLMADPAAYRRRLQDRLPLYRALGLQVDAAGSADEVVELALAALRSVAG
jgi:shikimate kinase